MRPLEIIENVPAKHRVKALAERVRRNLQIKAAEYAHAADGGDHLVLAHPGGDEIAFKDVWRKLLKVAGAVDTCLSPRYCRQTDVGSENDDARGCKRTQHLGCHDGQRIGFVPEDAAALQIRSPF